MFQRTRSRITRLFSLTVGIILMISAIFSLWMVQHILTTTENNQLTSLHRQYEDDLLTLYNSPKGKIIFDPSFSSEKRNASFAPSGLQLNQLAWLINANGEVIFESPATNKLSLSAETFPTLVLLPSVLAKPDGKYRNVRAEGRVFRIGGTTIQSLGMKDYRIIVAQEVTSDVELVKQLRWAFAGFAFVMLLSGAAAGYVLAGKAMVPIAQAFRRQEQFTSDASHELRTPLSILKSAVEVLEEQKENLPDFHRNVLAKTGREIHHMSRLVDNLLMLARSDNGRIELAISPVSLRRTIHQVIEQLEPIAGPKQVKLIWENESETSNTIDAIVRADEIRIRQLVFILVENAIKYNREGGEVSIAIDAGQQQSSFTISDTGIGVEEEHLPRIFERFYRMDQARTKRTEGTGLGLAIAKQIVDAHHGKLEVWSQPQVGTTFRVTLRNFSDSFQNVPIS